MTIKWHKKPALQKHILTCRRLINSSPIEIIYRLKSRIKNLEYRLGLWKNLRSNSDDTISERIAIDHLRNVKEKCEGRYQKYNKTQKSSNIQGLNSGCTAFIYQTNEIPTILEHYSDHHKKKIICEAEKILRHEFKLFGITKQFKNRIKWNEDPTTKKKWPMIFYGNLKYNSSIYTKDVKYIWELNRHTHFVLLGKAFAITGDQKYAKEFIFQINDWINSNPPEIGINWVDNLEVAVRSISWLWSYYIFKNSPLFDSKIQLKFIKGIYEHAHHLNSELTLYTCANNHLIGEAAALWMITVLFPEFKKSKKWRHDSFKILQNELKKQIHPDGVHAEQCIGYHRFVLDYYTQILVLAKKNGIHVPNEMLERIEKMFEFILALTDKNGKVPMIGDSDNARGIPVANKNFWEFRDSLSTGATLFNRPDMKTTAGRFHETSMWLLGLDGKRKFDAIGKPTVIETSRAFPKGGYYVMSDGDQSSKEMQLVFDCGTLGLPPRYGHGHADMLSITLSAFGQEMVTDPGTYGYMCAGNFRNYFRGTKAHNTVTVDDLEQADLYGTSRWLNIPQAKMHRWITTKNYDFADGSHNGYERLKNPITHRRMIFFLKSEYLIISDFLLGAGRHRYDQYYHFPLGSIELDPISKVAIMWGLNEKNVLIAPSDSYSVFADISEGSAAPFEGWISYSYGEKMPSPVVNYANESEAPSGFQTLVLPFMGESAPLLSTEPVVIYEKEHQEGTMGIKIKSNTFTDYLIASCSEAESRSWHKYQSDADIIYLRKYRNDRLRILLVNGSSFSINSTPCFKRDNRRDFEEFELIEGCVKIESASTS